MQSLCPHALLLHSALHTPSFQSTCRQARSGCATASALHASEQSVQTIHFAHVSSFASSCSHSQAAVYAALSVVDCAR